MLWRNQKEGEVEGARSAVAWESAWAPCFNRIWIDCRRIVSEVIVGHGYPDNFATGCTGRCGAVARDSIIASMQLQNLVILLWSNITINGHIRGVSRGPGIFGCWIKKESA